MSARNTLQERGHNEQQKLVYYIIALCVTCIGFSVHLTTSAKISIKQLPLGIAILSWGFSVFKGFRMILHTMKFISTNIDLLDIEAGKSDVVGKNPAAISYSKGLVSKKLDNISKKSTSYFKRQLSLFYFGMLSFVVWHIIEMYSR